MSDKLTFADEGARSAAINALGDDPSKLSELEAIRNASIGEAAEAAAEGANKPPEPQKPVEPAKPAQPTEPFTIKREELPEGYDTPGKAFKSLDEAQKLIKRQAEFIKTNLSQQRTQSEADALARAEKAEKELVTLRSGTPAAPSTVADISAVQTDIQKITTMQSEIDAVQKELDAKAEEDADYAFSTEYAKKSRELLKKNNELSRLQTGKLNELTGLFVKAQGEIQQAKSIATEFVTKNEQEKVKAETAKNTQKIYEQMDTLDVPELKLTKGSKEVENDYLAWRREVATARLGRPPENVQEEWEAIQQLQLKNPELIQRCSLIGVPTEPTEDIRRYMMQCEALDFMYGCRKDPVTGQLIRDAQGNPVRVTQLDPSTGKFVPVILPSLKAAVQQMRIDEGFYQKQVDGAFQAGAKSVAAAASRRDLGAVELHGGEDSGQTPGGQGWALKVLENTDPEEAMQEYRKGNKVKFDEINKARVALGVAPIVISD